MTQWGQSYTYDGFGNLTTEAVIKGSAPTLSVVYNASTNRQTGDSADANGNITTGGYVYDIENRLASANNGGTLYSYDIDNKRVWRSDSNASDEITFWSPMGQKLATYNVQAPYNNFQQTNTYAYFGAKMVLKNGGSVVQDRLGSIGKFYPYGQERPSATQNDTEKFTGYLRDAATGLDYADQRYHQSGVGRFMTPDPYSGSMNASDPGSWNRYAYVGGDPANKVDRQGTCGEDDNFGDCGYCNDRANWFDYPCDSGPCFDLCVTPDTGGGGGGGDEQRVPRGIFGPEISDARKTGILNRAVYNAELMLEEDPSCAALFHADGVDPVSVLQSLLDGDGQYGVLQWGTGAQFAGVGRAIGDPSDLALTRPLIDPSTGGISGVQILLNPMATGAFAQDTAQQQAQTLLHELGHLFYDLFGADSTEIGPDNLRQDPNGRQEDKNKFLINDNCQIPKPNTWRGPVGD